MKKILLVCGLSNYVLYFRKGLIAYLKSKGVDVSVIAFDDIYAKQIEELGVAFYCLKDNNRSINPLKILTLKKRYKKLIQTIAPDVVFTFMLKPNTFGVLAAKSAGITEIYSMVEGAGDVFINSGLKWCLIRAVVCALYKKSFKRCAKVFFLNQDDIAEFAKRGLVKKKQAVVVGGIGVDLQRFAFAPVRQDKDFLMVARMLKTKGIMEYCECARIVKKKYPDAVFRYLGGEGTVKVADIQEYIDDGSICYLGTTDDVRPYLKGCTAFILPSYREGMPVSTMEAEAVGRCVITSDSAGCRETVRDGYNGFIVPKKDVESLAKKAIWVIEHPETVKEMGCNARRFAEDNFDQEKINSSICEIIGLN